ncbi:MAG: hypothetical protein IPK26_22415 [Planctomycetes bacterium]|nr:hypothetical protein [Planctomycetota bacterium]
MPAILKDLGVREPVTMTEKDYDRLFVVTIRAERAAAAAAPWHPGARARSSN